MSAFAVAVLEQYQALHEKKFIASKLDRGIKLYEALYLDGRSDYDSISRSRVNFNHQPHNCHRLPLECRSHEFPER